MREVSISLPNNYYKSEETFPVLYMLDGYFKMAAGTVGFLSEEAGLIPPMIVVTIENTDRMRDMSPTNSLTSWDGKQYDEFKTSGGADNFLNFIGKELMPAINLKYRTSGENTLVGHSLCGLTVLYALQNYPELFKNYVAIDPSYWWDGELILKKENIEKLRDLKSGKNLYINLSQHHPDNLQEEKGAKKFVKILTDEKFKNLNWNFSHLKNEAHHTMLLRSLYEAMEFIYKPKD